ncbi:MAG: alpha-amylase family glycosyl hydrolase [Actinomycetota bacterium]|nr:alpha-amylase family glycosyl hydrolase [Actinomycetota bacterium]
MAHAGEHTIWWHVYPLGFLDAEPAAADRPPEAGPAHRLDRLAAWIPHAAALGCDGLMLGPVFASETHGYDTVDHFHLDPRLGDEDDLVRLIGAAHDAGMAVCLDGVFNHVGRGFDAFAAVLADGPDAPTASWFRLRWPDGAGEPDYDTFEGHDRLVALDHDEPAVADHVVAVMDHWCDRGVDAWRLDAAYAVPSGFWRTVTDRVRASHPDVWIFGEVIHGDYVAAVADGGLDSVTQYELWKATWSSIVDHNLFEVAWTLGRHDDLVAAFAPLTFVGNHDVTRLASTIDDDRLLPHAYALLLGVGGVPAIYAGDERAFRGVKEEREGGDDAVRPPFPDRPEDLPAGGEDLFATIRRLIDVRRAHPWLPRANTTSTTLANEVAVFVSQPLPAGSAPGTDADVGPDTPALAIALNLADEDGEAPTPPGPWTVAVGDGAALDGEVIRLGPCGWALLTRP